MCPPSRGAGQAPPPAGAGRGSYRSGVLRALVLDDAGVLSQAEPGMEALLGRARAQGLRTAVLSNTESRTSPYADLVDAAVLSGEAGVRKPQPEAYALVATRLGVRPQECVFVDDVAGHVRGAVAAGMVGVHHRSVRETTAELEALFGVPLTG